MRRAVALLCAVLLAIAGHQFVKSEDFIYAGFTGVAFVILAHMPPRDPAGAVALAAEPWRRSDAGPGPLPPGVGIRLPPFAPFARRHRPARPRGIAWLAISGGLALALLAANAFWNVGVDCGGSSLCGTELRLIASFVVVAIGWAAVTAFSIPLRWRR